MIETVEALARAFPLSEPVVAAARAVLRRWEYDDRARRAAIHAHVLSAFSGERMAESDLAGTLGYGYGDTARDRYESLLARALGAQRVLARLSLVSGTHAIVTALAALARGGAIVSVTGRPYDTLRSALCEAPDSLASRGIRYQELSMDFEGEDELRGSAGEAAHRGSDGGMSHTVCFIQRSRGYAARPSLSAARCGQLALDAKRRYPGATVVVDNCYGELVDESEPLAHGADIIAGSLIKNLGGGLAPGGGYIAGRADLIDRIASYHYAPGLGSAVGSSLGFGRDLIQGLFYAPLVVEQALAGLSFFAALFSELGYAVDPPVTGERHDIVQAIRLGDPRRVVAFTRGLQAAMPLNARFIPEPGPVPGYPGPVVMSAGGFVSGATIELSCDAPLREPYEVYVQGGVATAHALLGALFAANALAQENLLEAAKPARI